MPPDFGEIESQGICTGEYQTDHPAQCAQKHPQVKMYPYIDACDCGRINSKVFSNYKYTSFCIEHKRIRKKNIYIYIIEVLNLHSIYWFDARCNKLNDLLCAVLCSQENISNF